MFFQEVAKLVPEKGTVSFVVHRGQDNLLSLAMTVKPEIEGAQDRDTTLPPLLIKGSPTELDEQFTASVGAFTQSTAEVINTIQECVAANKAKMDEIKARSKTASTCKTSAPAKADRLKDPLAAEQEGILTTKPHSDKTFIATLKVASVATLKSAYQKAPTVSARQKISDELLALTGKSAQALGLTPPTGQMGMFATPSPGPAPEPTVEPAAPEEAAPPSASAPASDTETDSQIRTCRVCGESVATIEASGGTMVETDLCSSCVSGEEG